MTKTITPGTAVGKVQVAQVFYQFDWTKYLADLLTATESIATSTFTITGDDALLTFDNAGIVIGNKKTQLRLSGGTVGKAYTVTNRIVTDGVPATTDSQSFVVLVK